MQFDRYKYLREHMFEQDAAGNIKQHHDRIEASKLPSLVLAYIGDAYFNLFVRTRLLFFEQHKVHVLNDFGAKIVSAVYQAYAYRNLKEDLDETERDIFRRAYNAKSHAPRAASVADYHTSTGLEAIIGYLRLSANQSRADELCEKSFQLIIRSIYDELHK